MLYAHIRGGSLARGRQMRVGWSKMAIFASFARYIFRNFTSKATFIIYIDYVAHLWLFSDTEIDFNAKWSFKVIYFGIIEEQLKGLHSTIYNKCGLRCEGSEDMASETSENRHFRLPHSHLRANPREYPLIVWVYLHSNFSGWLRKTCVMQQSA